MIVGGTVKQKQLRNHLVVEPTHLKHIHPSNWIVSGRLKIKTFESTSHGNPQPSFLRVMTHPYIEGLKPSFFMVLGSKGRGAFLFRNSLPPISLPGGLESSELESPDACKNTHRLVEVPMQWNETYWAMKKQHVITWQMGNPNFAMVTITGDTPRKNKFP